MKHSAKHQQLMKLKTESLVLSLKALQVAKQKNLVKTINVKPIKLPKS